ncbi:DNL zinc finger domain containing protein [Metarhizium album ARSEF 1941]|uniref:DNL zinc finger domain containing protein n=1 Tax=Metarhizium album (strain ARSEF 1941) TaxID=1081103 RepID=A0A0B2X2L1_METAS|nr:DNL zinc finger domain containing protein [Metarhizium album ARSEF 1941]KHN99977.1 DNL zinc finger domain containing protein [Metarhizium album ARSEF 1941]
MAARATQPLYSILRRLRPQGLRAIPFRQSAFRSAKPVAPVVARAAHSIPRPSQKPVYLSPEAEAQANESGEAPVSEGPRPKANPAYYQLSFTCVPCGHRSHHNVSKQGYHTGSVLITCPSCRNRHVISDHLNIFGDRKITVEDLVRERGGLVKRGSLGEDGDVEFWPEETRSRAQTEKER